MSAVILLCLGSPNRLLHWFPAALIGIAPLWWVCWQQPWRSQIRDCFGVWFIVCAFAFLPDVFSVKALTIWEIVGGVVIAPVVPLFYVTASVLSLQWSRSVPDWSRPLAMATLWTGLDGILGLLKFPIPFHWGSLIFDWPLGIQIADFSSVWGVTWFAVLINATLAGIPPLVRRWNLASLNRLLGIGLGVLVGVMGYGLWRLTSLEALLPTLPQYQVGTVQPVAWLDGDLSWATRVKRYQDLQQLSEQTIAAGAELIVWPEGALRAQVAGTVLEQVALDPVLKMLPSQGGLITGAAEPVPALPNTRQEQFYNSALLYTSSGQPQDRYAKQWLFPFFEDNRYRPSPDGFRPLRGGERLGLLGVQICLESVLPFPSRHLTQRGAESLLVISDDSWFGNSNWPMLHGNLAVLRAVENRRSVVFVNNTGGNLIVDPTGRIQQAGRIFERGSVTGTVYRLTDLTLSTRWGDWMTGVCAGATGLLGVLTLKSNQSKPRRL